MSPECSPADDVAGGGMNYRETELTLGQPGESRQKSGAKRGFSENKIISQAAAKSPQAKNQVVGWPPVRSFRQNIIKPAGKFVKVAVDGAPYLRKVDLENYNSYQQFLSALGDLFTCFTIRNNQVIDAVNGSVYAPTYEDKDGDWMLVGDVPWKMFVESCKRVRLMKSSEAKGLAPKTPPNCSSSSS